MDPIGVNTKPYNPPPPATPEARASEKKTEKPTSNGPTGNPIMDAVQPPATPAERKGLAEFALHASKPAPQPTDRRPIGHVLIEKLAPRPTFGALLDTARTSSDPNTTIGPVAWKDGNAAISDAARQKECEAVASSVGGFVPMAGKAVELEIKEACAAKPKPSFGLLPDVPLEKPKGTALPNTAAEGGDVPWKPIAK